ncbi:hypothetical protein HYPSUDRAFT_200557 [Hypholoma sublateritium FD-334 SS-4]|uniref:Uncharacterized protein n=1 Tax=Hypholoma sublateritium (strain FD-334 SS-4) TaxID=945553 RepID=A0A0D2P068_HYPSF|nr:hypothetical protein HYPSUDRAFT_200557 [Hypholoma sublateritium FD-334 SS-4]
MGPGADTPPTFTAGEVSVTEVSPGADPSVPGAAPEDGGRGASPPGQLDKGHIQDEDVVMADAIPPTVNVIPPTPSNSQLEGNGEAPVEREVPASREAARLLIAGWGLNTGELPSGPPATRTRGRSHANSAQTLQVDAVPCLQTRQVASAELESRGRKETSPRLPTPLP